MLKSRVKINSADYFSEEAEASVGAYFGKVRKGQPDVYDTPFARGESTKKLLSAWMETLVSISNEWPSLWEFEKDLAGKVGPMSIMKPLKERMVDIDHYYSGILLPGKPISESAIAAVKREWSSHRGLMVRRQEQTVEIMKKSSNSGNPYFTKRRNVVNDTIPCYMYHDYQLIQQLKHSRWPAAAILGWRGQEGGSKEDDVKQRVVWMFPFAVNVCELQVYQPIIEAAQRFNIVPSWVSMDEVDRVVTKLFDTKSSNDLIVCTDFSKFDQHFNKYLQAAAHTLIAAIFKGDERIRDWLDNIYPIKYEIPLLIQQDCMIVGDHGMGSGSGGTNADETLAHRALQYEAAINRGKLLNPNSQCLGDDGILSYPGITAEDVMNSYTSHGLEMNAEKQYESSNDCVYLRRWHHKDYRIRGVCAGVYSTCRALGRLRYLERFYDPEDWGPKMVALRQLSIIENVKYHPLRDQFAEFCMKRDKYRLGIDIPGFLDNIEKEAHKAIDHIPDFLGYTKTLQTGGNSFSGISKWWIVQYLKSK